MGFFVFTGTRKHFGNSLVRNNEKQMDNSDDNERLLNKNKNQFVLAYLCWRVITGRHCEIEYCMQIPGDTR